MRKIYTIISDNENRKDRICQSELSHSLVSKAQNKYEALTVGCHGLIAGKLNSKYAKFENKSITCK